MPDFWKGLIDQRGRPIEKRVLTEEVAGATLTGVRTPHTGYPADGLNPIRLAAIMKEADQGHPVRQLELAETIEERDPHLIGVLGTRRRSVSQLDIIVDAASSDPLHEKQAEMVRDWLARDELQSELFDMLDAIHKGYSFTEIIWSASEGQWRPERLEWRDPRWFDFDRRDLTTPLLLTEGGQSVPLPGGKFIYNRMPAKSGIPTRSGLSRITAWAWMFKAFTMRDWAIFTQSYGQPIRVGKYGQGASKDDKAALFRAIANVAGDMAAMIPESMKIEFVEAANVGASSGLYENRVAYLDQQISKAVLGQTATTDAIAGGHAVGQEHREVQGDIERADAKQLSATINRDLVKLWIDLEFGPQQDYPRAQIGRQEVKDVKMIVGAVRELRLPVKKSEMYDLIGVSAPGAGDDVLVFGSDEGGDGEHKPGVPGEGDKANGKEEQTLHAQQAPLLPEQDELAELGLYLARDAQSDLLDAIGGIVRSAKSLDEVRLAIKGLAPQIDKAALRDAVRKALVIAQLMGRRDLLDGQ
jgi:phage gp29-like protein